MRSADHYEDEAVKSLEHEPSDPGWVARAQVLATLALAAAVEEQRMNGFPIEVVGISGSGRP